MTETAVVPDKTVGDCPICGKSRWANILCEKVNEHGEEVWSRTTHRLLECGGCQTVYYEHIHLFSEDADPETGELIPRIVYFPPLSKRTRPQWLYLVSWYTDFDLAELLESLYTALDRNLTVLAASGIRTVFDVATTRLGIDPALTFEEKLAALKEQGRIGQRDHDGLTAMVEAANAAMHRGWKPGGDELDTMMATLERFIHHSFILDGSAARLKAKVPPKPKRQKPGVT